MKITVLGARGRVGSRVVNEALSRGHAVTAVVRKPAQRAGLPLSASVRVADVSVPEQVAALAAGQDLVVNATRPIPGEEQVIRAVTRGINEGVARVGTRLIVVGGAAVLEVPGSAGRRLLDDPRCLPAAYRTIGEASALQFEQYQQESRFDWAYLCPPAQLEPGERSGRYRLGRNTLLLDAQGNSAISMEDLAVALLDEAEVPRHHRTLFTVAADAASAEEGKL